MNEPRGAPAAAEEFWGTGDLATGMGVVGGLAAGVGARRAAGAGEGADVLGATGALSDAAIFSSSSRNEAIIVWFMG